MNFLEAVEWKYNKTDEDYIVKNIGISFIATSFLFIFIRGLMSINWSTFPNINDIGGVFICISFFTGVILLLTLFLNYKKNVYFKTLKELKR
jgi:hypothetical protein